MSSPNFNCVALPPASSVSTVDSSGVVSVIGTSWNQAPSLPGCRPMRSNCALMYSTVFSPPVVPGPRPSNSSEDSVFTNSAKSPASMSSLNVCAAASGVASPAGVAAALASSLAGVGARSHADSAAPASRQNRRCRACIRRVLCGGSSRFYAPAQRLAGVRAAARSVAWRARGVERDRRGAGDLADACAGMHVKRDFALEHQVAVDHRVGADHDARLAVAAEADRHPVRRRLVDLEPAAHVRVDADGDVAADRLDAAAHFGGDDADGAVDGLDALGDVAAAADEDAAVDRFQAAGDARALAQADAAVDGAQIVGLDVVARLDAAV